MTDAGRENEMLALLAGVLVVSGLVFIDTAPFVADYVAMVMGLAGLAVAIRQRDAILAARGWLMLLLALVLIALTLPFVYHGAQDVVPLLALAPVLLVPGVAFLVGRSRQLLSPYALPLLCLFGAVAAALLGLSDYGVGEIRVGAGNNPIHYGGIAVLLGFMALTGIAAGRSPWRLLFLLGPIAGIVAAILSGSRGPLLGGVAMAVVGGPILLFWYRRDRAVLVTAAVLALGAIGLALTLGPSSRAMMAFGQIGQVLQTGGLQDFDVYRTAMYHSAWEQFQMSPIFGRGFGQVMPWTRAAFPDLPELQTLEHLHSDLSDFAAMAGLFGLAAYGLILSAPLANLGAKGPAGRVVALGSALLATGYLALGLTNAMFGVLPQTVLFVVLLGYLIALRRAGDAPGVT